MTILLQDIAKDLGISRAHLARVLRRELGLPPGTYLRGLRMDRARALLENGERSVNEIAREVGYASVSAFVAAFHRTTGSTPQAWRRRVRGPRRG